MLECGTCRASFLMRSVGSSTRFDGRNKMIEMLEKMCEALKYCGVNREWRAEEENMENRLKMAHMYMVQVAVTTSGVKPDQLTPCNTHFLSHITTITHSTQGEDKGQ